MARLPKGASVRRLHRARARGIVIKNTPPPLIDDFNIDDIDISDLAPSSPPTTSSTPSTTTTTKRYNSLDLILMFVQSNLSAGLAGARSPFAIFVFGFLAFKLHES
jgi:hypothetical protein